MSIQKKNSTKLLKGVIKRHPDGFGFFIPDDPHLPDIYISREDMEGIMTNDHVEIEVKTSRSGRSRGVIKKVLSHGLHKVSGRLHLLSPSQGLLLDESHGWGEDLKINIPPHLQVKDGDWVFVEILTYPNSPRGLTGKIIGVIGDVHDPLNDDKRTLFTQGITIDFPHEVLKQAEGLPDEVSQEDIHSRKNLMDLPFMTIDGQTAKDFDDAIFVKSHDKGFNLKVAIADVSHYVPFSSPLDEEAYRRGNSTYFPHFVVPMLPEKLSNGLCSLKPHVPRCAFVADLEIDFQGELIQSSFYEAVIQSHARITYGEAQEVLDGHSIEKLKPVETYLHEAAQLAKILMKQRFKKGSLNFEIPETEVILDEQGEPIDIMAAERLFSHKLIEELMLIANVAVARFLSSQKVPTLYRIHEPPHEDALKILTSFLEAFGFHKKIEGQNLQKKITKALKHFEGRPEEHILSILALRSMNQAQYSPDNIGHFGLGFKDYTHFTSPIRRYPDLIVHRILKTFIKTQKTYSRYSYEKLKEAGAWLSACEQRSVKAERQFYSIKKARFMKQFIGEKFEGIISSVTKFGLFVTLRQYDVDGLVKLEALKGDYFQFDEEHLRLVGKRSGFTYALGDWIEVIVAKADAELGRIEFVLEASLQDSSKETSKKRKKKRRPKTSKHKKTKTSRTKKKKKKTSKKRKAR